MMRLHTQKIVFFSAFLLLGFAFAKAQTATVTVNADPKIEQLVTLKAQMTKNNELADRYKIQLFSGERSVAEARIKRYRNEVGLWASSIQYETPNYKVWVGNFRNRLEADRALMVIRKEFPAAFIFKPER